MEEFKIISQLDITHEYWNISSPELFDIQFTSDTNDLLKKLKIQYRQIGNTIHFLGHKNALAFLSENREELSFGIQLLLRDSSLVNYTDIQQSDDRQVLCFKSSPDQKDLMDSIELLPIRRSLAQLYVEYPDHQLVDGNGKDVLTDFLIQPDEPGFGRSLDAMSEGVYTSSDSSVGTFYFQPKLVKGLFAVVELKLDHSDWPQEHQLNFKSRSVMLSYRVKSDQHDLNKLRVIDADDNISFEGKPIDDEMIFTSDQSVKLTEKPAFNFQLLNGTKKPIRQYMSLGTTNNFKIFNQDGSQYLNEILINI
ncbi:MAG: hypothetical protein ABJF11_03205 [Reichenbachiella sp.]|uniref:hypothetical protein n=1 Tax=Reichenbachiella sp. TaxID=2184521 RepID=UPI003264968C